MKKYGVVGNRTGFTYKEVKNRLEQHNIKADDCIISGGANGVDTYAQMYAKEIGVKLIIFYPNPKISSPYRYYDRNILIANECNELIAFNKKAKGGTIHTMHHAKGLNKKIRIYQD